MVFLIKDLKISDRAISLLLYRDAENHRRCARARATLVNKRMRRKWTKDHSAACKSIGK